jgi:hypothetical protein
MQADEETEGSGSEQSDGGLSLMVDDGENDSNQDLDASMEDLDDDGVPVQRITMMKTSRQMTWMTTQIFFEPEL